MSGCEPSATSPAWAGLEENIQERLLDTATIEAKVSDLAADISRDYQGQDLLLVGVLCGSFVFLADLMRRICLPLQVEFVCLSSYGSGTESSGQIRMLKDLAGPVAGRHILIVEDITDSGRTLKYLVELLRGRGAASVRTCCLLDKPSRREVDFAPDYCGFEIPDAFVVGYGLDFANLYRNLPYVAVLKPEAYEP